MRVVFENATIADSVKKASRVAPTRGEAFDKANGMLVSLDPEEGTVTLRTTDLNLHYLEVVDAVEVEGEGDWRFNALLLADVVGKLPIGSGKNVSFEQKGGEVHMKSGRTVARFRTMDVTYYPKWDPFDPEELEIVPDLGARIKQVEWAAMDDPEVVISGIHLDGKRVMATDRIRMAFAPCEAEPIYKPVTIPAGILKPVIANLRDVAIGISNGEFLLMPDVSTQIKTRIYEREYPDIMKVIEQRTWPQSIKVRKTALLEIIERAEVFAQRDRAPKMEMIIGKGEVAVSCSDAELGLLGDVLELDGQADHKRHYIYFTPKNLKEALQAAPSEELILYYHIEQPVYPIKIDGGSGYVAVVQTRRITEGDGG